MVRNGQERKGFPHASVRTDENCEGGGDAPDGAAGRSRTATMAALRHAIGRIEGGGASVPFGPGGEDQKPNESTPRLPLGAPVFDAALGGGLPRAGLVEIRTRAVRDGGAAIGFALALGALLQASPRRPLVWIAPADAFSEGGLLYRQGVAHFGLDPDALVVVRTRSVADAAWAGEEAARSGAPALTVLEVRGNPALLGLEGSRRLHTRARDAGRPLLLLRQGGEAEAGAAPLRLLLEPGRAAPLGGLEALPLLGRPRFLVHLEKARDLSSRSLSLEWDPHDRRFLDPVSEPARDAHAVPGGSPSPAVQRPDPARGGGSFVALRSQ